MPGWPLVLISKTPVLSSFPRKVGLHFQAPFKLSVGSDMGERRKLKEQVHDFLRPFSTAAETQESTHLAWVSEQLRGAAPPADR